MLGSQGRVSPDADFSMLLEKANTFGGSSLSVAHAGCVFGVFPDDAGFFMLHHGKCCKSTIALELANRGCLDQGS